MTINDSADSNKEMNWKKAIETLEKLLDCGNQEVRLEAAKTLLELE